MADKTRAVTAASTGIRPLLQRMTAIPLAKELIKSDDPETVAYLHRRGTELALGYLRKSPEIPKEERLRLQRLLRSGLNADSCDGLGKTLLMAACYAGDLETITLLRNLHADMELVDEFGANAAEWAKRGVNAQGVLGILLGRNPEA